MIIEPPQTGSVGLIVDGLIALRRAYQSAFHPVPPIYLAMHQLRGISSVINPDPRASDSLDEPIFVLAIDQLLPIASSR